jgi:tRNA G18 (ribose-2'-O)-methylase SpoU
MSGKSESLNASAAAAVALFEVRRRWQSDLDR